MKELFRRQNSEDENFMADSKAAFLNRTTVLANAILYVVCAMIIIGLIWAYFGEIDQVTVGEGKVIASSENKIIQSLDGGIITDILVHEGEIVQPNQILVKLDDTRYSADYRTGYAKYLALSAVVARLTAEAQGYDHITFPPEVVKDQPELVTRETDLFNKRRQALQDEVGNLQKSLDVANKQVDMYPALLIKGYASKLEYYRAQQNSFDIQQRLYEKNNKFQEDAATQLNQQKAELASVTEQLTSLRDKMQRTTLLSPVHGVVKKVNITTLGGVVSPGMNIMEIVPLEDTLLVQVRVKPSDIAFIKVGDSASIKITAYDYTIYGSLAGTVEYISPDAIDASKQQSPSPTDKVLPEYYLINVRTQKNYLGTEKRKLPIIPGMMASVHIKTGHNTVMSYLLKPIFKAKEEALKEK